jgi:hypothetical protein
MRMAVDTFFKISNFPMESEPSHKVSKHVRMYVPSLTWEEFEVLYGIPNDSKGGEDDEDTENS